jgi:hypothetical protein
VLVPDGTQMLQGCMKMLKRRGYDRCNRYGSSELANGSQTYWMLRIELCFFLFFLETAELVHKQND